MREFTILIAIVLSALVKRSSGVAHVGTCQNFPSYQVFRIQIIGRQCVPVSNYDIRAFIRIPYDVRNYRIVDCAAVADGQPPAVVRVLRNQSKIQEALNKRDEYGRPFCYVVVFYGEGCPFSGKMAEVVNALPRIYPQLNVLAIDASLTTKFNSRYGVAGTPTVILYQDSHIRARLAAGYTPLETVVKTISDFTDLQPVSKNFTILDEEKQGPLIVQPDYYSRQLYLISSVVGLLVVSVYSVWNSEIAQSMVVFVKSHFRTQNANV